jgi:(1->4)-alpha-D-glucan 1-alpha-D-glucosylmutase
MQEYALKAAREGKQETSWLNPHEPYEAGVKSFIAKILDPSLSGEFLASLQTLAQRLSLLGALNSLSQITLKATMPGVPDFYQGTELWDFSLVDPDNRRPVDLPARAALLKSIGDNPDWRALAASWPDGRIKLALTCRLLALRQQLPQVFTDGAYRPLAVEGAHADEIVAFARVSGRDAVIVACSRSFGRATDGGRRWPAGDAWDATLSVEGFSAIGDALAAGNVPDGSRLAASELFDALPVALLRAQHAPAKRDRQPEKRKSGLALKEPARV